MLEERNCGAGIPPETYERADAAQEAAVKTRRNCLLSRAGVLAASLVAASLCAGTLCAQNSEIVSRLPANTVGFVEWRGASALSGAAQQNHVLQLMQDPAMAPLWLGIAANIEKSKQNGKGPAPALSLPEVVSLLQNPVAAGIIELPRSEEATTAGKPTAPIAVFVVYDATGKSQLIEKWEASTETRGPKPRHYDFSGASVEERTYPTGNTDYTAIAGRYFVSSDKKAVIEELITRYSAARVPAESITQRPEYAEVRKFVGSDAGFDYFARVPNIKEWRLASATDKSQSALKFFSALHFEKIHAIGGSVSFAGEAMHIRGAILGSTLPVGPLDFAGPSSTSFQTLSIAGAGPEFSVSRVNFGAMYRLVMDAVSTILPEQQAANVRAAQGMAQGFLGMSIPDALDLFTGELASASTFADDGTQQRVFAATIQKPDAVLHILRAVLGPMTLAEDTFGNATMLDIAYPYRDPTTGLKRRTLYYVAVTPQMLLVAPRKSMLRETLEGLSASPAANTAAKGVLAAPEYAQMRAQLPEKLSGLGAEDLTRIPWNALWTNFETRSEQSEKDSPRASKTDYTPDFCWMKLVSPDVIPRHLHMAVSGWWKDSNGVYFDSRVQ